MLTIDRLTKKYGKNGINLLSFEVNKGDVIGIVGPNGVGKTTLLQCIAGIITPDSGDIQFDYKTITYPNPSLIGYLPEFSSLPSNLTPRQTLLYVLKMNREEAKSESIDVILEEYQIKGFADKRNEYLSQGMQKRVMMALAFQTDPQVILLDEPTNGLDTAGLILLKRKIRESSEAGKIVLMSSHVLDFICSMQCKILLLNGDRSQMLDVNGTNDLEAEYVNFFGLA